MTADASTAEVIVVNTCAFIDNAKEESVNAILEMAQLKRDGSCKKADRHGLPGRTISRSVEGGDSRDRRLPRHR